MARRKIPDNLEYRQFMHASQFQGTDRVGRQQECLLLVLSAEGLSLLATMESYMPGTVAVTRRDLAKIVRKARQKGVI